MILVDSCWFRLILKKSKFRRPGFRLSSKSYRIDFEIIITDKDLHQCVSPVAISRLNLLVGFHQMLFQYLLIIQYLANVIYQLDGSWKQDMKIFEAISLARGALMMVLAIDCVVVCRPTWAKRG